MTAKALSLLSGGLDSQLAVCVLKDQGIDVHGITFESPFFKAGQARKAAEWLKIPLHIVDFTQEILALLKDPPHGFGAGMNPCIDCHSQMIRKAGGIMKEMGFHFLSTGEVLNQRPMSQKRKSLAIVTEESGCGDFLVRPLSAKLLPETEPERRGWVDREKLLAIEGRNRKAQYKLAGRYGLKDIPQPAGGCKLTEPNFCKRLQELKNHEGLSDVRAIDLLRIGRQFRLSNSIRLIVGRDQAENESLEKIARAEDILIKIDAMPGPTCILSSSAVECEIVTAAGICAGYSDCQAGIPVKIGVSSSAGSRVVEVLPKAREEFEMLRI